MLIISFWCSLQVTPSGERVESWAKVQDLSDKIIIACVWASGEWKLFVCSAISMPDKVTINTAYYKNNTQREQKGKRWFRIFSVATVTGRWLSSIISDLWLPKFPIACCSLSCCCPWSQWNKTNWYWHHFPECEDYDEVPTADVRYAS